MTRRTPKLTVITAAVVTLVLCGCGAVDRAGGDAAAQAHTLRFAMGGSEQPTDDLMAWARDVKQGSGGTLEIEFVGEYANLDPNQESRIIADVRSGAIELGRVGTRALDVNGYDEFQPLLTPFLVDSYELQAKVFQQGIPAQMASGLDPIGISRWACCPAHSDGS